jgi:hypothetical protein
MTEIKYAAGEATPVEVQAQVEAFFDELRSDDKLRDEVAAAGVDPDELARGGPDAFTVRPESEGMDPVITPIIVGIGIHIGTKAWDEVILPWIKRRRGEDAIGDEEDRSQ